MTIGDIIRAQEAHFAKHGGYLAQCFVNEDMTCRFTLQHQLPGEQPKDLAIRNIPSNKAPEDALDDLLIELGISTNQSIDIHVTC